MRWLWLLLGLCLSACGGLGGEPLIVSTIAAPAATEARAPMAADWAPNINNGARIFADRCSECHGADGAGRGDLVAAGSVPPPIDMNDAALVAAKSPLDWFDIISQGKIDKLMPPWENALSPQERWDVALYSYTLHYDADLLTAGQRLWGQCADCALPAAVPPIISDQQYGAQLNQTLFGGALSERESAAAAAYARMQSLPAPPAAVEATPTVPLAAISGRLRQGSAGATVPPDTVLQLQYGNEELGFAIAETTSAADNSFTFEAIPMTGAHLYPRRRLWATPLQPDLNGGGAGGRAARNHYL